MNYLKKTAQECGAVMVVRCKTVGGAVHVVWCMWCGAGGAVHIVQCSPLLINADGPS